MNPRTLHKISYGLYVVCSRSGDDFNGQIANALFQVTSDPPTIAISINKQNYTHEFIQKSRIFSVSILHQDAPLIFIGTFGFKSGRDVNKFQNVRYKIGKTEVPIVLDNSIAYLEVKVFDQIDVGTHTVFIGKIKEAEIVSDKNPMTYEYYHKVKKGVSPKTAPTYTVELDLKKEVEKMDKYRCKVCGYLYDPENGDPENNVPPGTKFEGLPEDWVCPVCGASKDEFEKESE